MGDDKVEVIVYENLRVNGYNIESIKNLKITTTINDHATLELTGVLKNEEKDKDINLTTENKTIEVYCTGDKDLTLFYGVVTNIKINVDNEVYSINLQAKSMSYLMDIKIESRSFQDVGMTTQMLINQIMGDYASAKYIVNIPNEPMKELLIQYEETDWQFIKRIASKYNQGILPTKDYKGIQYYIGAQEQKKELKTQNISYEVFKEIIDYQYMLQNHLQDAKEIDYISYKIQNHEILNLGDNIQLQNQSFYVYEGIYEMKDGILENTYKLRIKNGIRQKKLYNTKIIGSSIEGKIIGVQNDLVKVHLEIDKSQDEGKAYWFKYSTMSASKDGSGWYCMPEKSDSVKVYFPTKDEDEAFVISSVSGYEVGPSGGEDRMGNPDDKYLRTAQDKEVKLTPEGIFISCNSGQAEMSLKSDGTLSVVSQNNLNVQASENIKIEAKKSFLISAKESITIACDKNGGLDFDKEGQIREKGTKVNNN
ncbi:phage baseplate assembly protein V [Clostridium estertheticum]|uniref:phage baseplate assembly protein V n=1 Tax=Clostridium estertheticum TaxID=238834 RepID=UPI001CF4BA8B|nr:phage baseplate assembly protein V [Clostridium estertheticum]MCB2359252.1 phage baseplate assembly protein V [Clostridium estertheticum]